MRRSQRDAEFEAYVAAARPRLRRLAYSLCGDWHGADDVVQTALAKLYVAWPRVSRASNPDAYVRRTVARTTIDESRRPWRRERSGLDGHDRAADKPDVAAPRGPRGSPPAAAGDAAQDRGAAALARAVRRRDRHDLGIAEGTVKSHTSRALAALHELMNEVDHR